MLNKRLNFLINRQNIYPAVWVSAGFLAVDGVGLALLPLLNVSYGPVLPTLAVFACLRAGLFMLWLLVLAGLAAVRAGALHGHTLRILVVLNLVLLGAAVDAFYVEPLRLTVERIEIPVPGLTHAVRIVQLSDLHVERTTRRERALPGLVASLHPDMILLDGDYLNKSFTHDALAASDLRLLLAQLHAPLGIYAVNGNVETPEEMDVLLAGLDIHPLENEVVRFPALGEHFVMIGLNYIDLFAELPILQRLMQQVKPDDFSLLLYHTPEIAYTARDLHVSFYLTGHTHGGQVRLPFYGAVITNSHLGKTFEMGLYHVGQMTMYITRGLGMAGGSAGLRARFLCPPEVTVVDLVPGGTPGTAGTPGPAGKQATPGAPGGQSLQ